MTNSYEGDPKMFLDEDGMYLKFVNGQTVMDSGIENATISSVLTEEGWYGNIFAKTDEEKLGSKFIATSKKAITVDSLNDNRSAIEKALKWMVDRQIYSEVLVRVFNPKGNGLTVNIAGVSLTGIALTLSRAFSNWKAQFQNPAHRRE